MNKYNVIKEQLSGSKFVDQGFNITLGNNVYVSVMFGTGSYSDQGETTAEVAIIDSKDNWYVFNGKELEQSDGPDVNPRVTTNDLVEILYLAKQI